MNFVLTLQMRFVAKKTIRNPNQEGGSMNTTGKIAKVFENVMLVPALVLFGLLTGCAQNKDVVKDKDVLKEAATVIEKTEKKIEAR